MRSVVRGTLAPPPPPPPPRYVWFQIRGGGMEAGGWGGSGARRGVKRGESASAMGNFTPGVSHGASFLRAPGSLVRRRLARVTHNHWPFIVHVFKRPLFPPVWVWIVTKNKPKNDNTERETKSSHLFGKLTAAILNPCYEHRSCAPVKFRVCVPPTRSSFRPRGAGGYKHQFNGSRIMELEAAVGAPAEGRTVCLRPSTRCTSSAGRTST